MSQAPASEFGSMGMATEQATRMLKVYRKKLSACKDELNLGELEFELVQMLKLVKEKRVPNDIASAEQSKTPRGSLRRMKSKPAVAAAEHDVDDLAALMDRTNLAERSPVGVKS